MNPGPAPPRPAGVGPRFPAAHAGRGRRGPVRRGVRAGRVSIVCGSRGSPIELIVQAGPSIASLRYLYSIPFNLNG